MKKTLTLEDSAVFSIYCIKMSIVKIHFEAICKLNLHLNLAWHLHFAKSLNKLKQKHLQSDIARLVRYRKSKNTCLIHRLLLLAYFQVHFNNNLQVETMQFIVHALVESLYLRFIRPF